MTLAALLTLIACGTACTRLLLFRRTGLRHRWGVSALAWVLIASTGSMALQILLHPALPITWPQAGMACVVCLATWLARGNLAHLLRPHP